MAAFTQLLRNGAPNTLQTDKGTDFLNRPLQKLSKEHGVHHFATHNDETKASIVERFNRTLKTRTWRYFTKTTVGSIRRRHACFYAIVQRHISPQCRYGSIRSEQHRSGIRVTTSVCSRKRRQTNVQSRRSVTHRQSETTLRERIHGELNRITVYDC